MSQYIREYPSVKTAQRDLGRWSRAGFEVVSTTQLTQNPGCMRFLMLGIFSLVFRPKPHVVVTYRGEGRPPFHYGVIGWMLGVPFLVWSLRFTVISYKWGYAFSRERVYPWLRDVAVPFVVAQTRAAYVWIATTVVPAARARIQALRPEKKLPLPTEAPKND